jgi:hypothetical protein
VTQRCRHCRKRSGTQARGLCRTCHSRPSVRALYPSGGRWGRRGLGRGNVAGEEPKEPTAEPPGSLEKMKVMRARLERGESLHHGADARTPDPKKMLPFLSERPWRPGEPTGLE